MSARLAGAPPGTRRGPAPVATTEPGPTRRDATAKQHNRRPVQGATARRQSQHDGPPEVWAQVVVVAGRTRPRALLIVHCPYCGARHVHHAAPDVLATVKKASCTHGNYRIHAGVLRAEAAA